MDGKRLLTTFASAALLAGALVLSVPGAAHAEDTKTVSPDIMTWAWYWEQADSKDFETPQGTVTVDTNNEFCPQVPGGGLGNVSEESCADGRLPVRIVRGNYDEPNQMSAVSFDTLSTIPLESEVHSFKATFLEAKAGCREKRDAPTGQQCETTQPANAEGHELQACLVNQVFGEGAARPTREVPNHECTPSDPTAERKKVKIDGEERFSYTFDLTEYAKLWASGENLASSILITGAQPKETGPQDSWRVVLEGPVEKKGIEVDATITPAEIVPPAPPTEPPAPPGTDPIYSPGTPGTPGTPAVPGTPGTDATTGDSTGAAGAAPTDTGKTEGEQPVDAAEQPGTDLAAADQPIPGGGLPGYAWLALAAGMVGFSLLRRAVFDTTAGIRPDGVLAQIQKLNAQRRGTSLAASMPQPAILAALATTAGVARGATKKVTGTISGLAGKLKRSKGQ